MHKIILDTNLWIKFLLSGGLEAIEILLEEERIEIIVSHELIKEIEDVTARPKFAKVINPHKTRAIKQFIKNYATYVTSSSNINVSRDPKDDFLLALAIDSSADFIITGDKDLLVLNPFKKTQIVSYQQFIVLMLEK